MQQNIREAAHEVQRPVFFARGIIIASYLPIFTLQAVEGRLFKPMAWTVSFALLGALVFAMLVAPVMSTSTFRKGAKEFQNPLMSWLIAALPHFRPLRHRNTIGSPSPSPPSSSPRHLPHIRRPHRLRIPSPP